MKFAKTNVIKFYKESLFIVGITTPYANRDRDKEHLGNNCFVVTAIDNSNQLYKVRNKNGILT